MDAELVLDARAALGEGPVWDAGEGLLLWVDVLAGEVHRFDPVSGRDETIVLGTPVGAVLLRASGGLVVCRRGGIEALDPATGRRELLVEVDSPSRHILMNDAACDAAGRLFAGTYDEREVAGAGALYRLDPTLELTDVVHEVTVSNGIGWSPDGQTMYYVDSPTRRVDAFAYDPASGELRDRRAFVESSGEPQPDGLCVDEEGCIWVAFWDGWCVRRFSREGELVAEVAIPVERVTSCCFGGPGLDELYVTTARPDDPDPAQPLAGSLFRLRPGVRGLETHAFAG